MLRACQTVATATTSGPHLHFLRIAEIGGSQKARRREAGHAMKGMQTYAAALHGTRVHMRMRRWRTMVRGRGVSKGTVLRG